MTEIRSLFATTITALGRWLDEQQGELVGWFEGPSALADFSVRGLAGHLLRAMTVVETYLDQSLDPGEDGGTVEVLSGAAYYAGILPADGRLDSEFNRAIRQRGLEAAPDNATDFPAVWADTAGRLIARLEGEPDDRLVTVYGGLVLTLDEYLVTRLVELVVHADDLATSLSVEGPALPPDATGLVITTLVEVARLRHGDTAVVRALSRRERDTGEALRVM